MQSGGCIHSDIFFSVDTLTCSQMAVSIVLSFYEDTLKFSQITVSIVLSFCCGCLVL